MFSVVAARATERGLQSAGMAVLTFLRDKSRAPFAERSADLSRLKAVPLPRDRGWGAKHAQQAPGHGRASVGGVGNPGLCGVIRRMTLRKNEAKSSGIWAAHTHLAKMRNDATKKTEILFKKTLTQTGDPEKLAPHTE